MSDAELVHALKVLKYEPGPMTVSSRSIYERLYMNLAKEQEVVLAPP